MPSALSNLYTSLHDEKRALVRQAVTDNKFHRLPKDDKLQVTEMSHEIQHFEQYIKDLREAHALNTFIRLVQEHTLRSVREIRKQLQATVARILSSDLRGALTMLEPIVLRHEQLLSYLQSQRFRSAPVCCNHGDPTSSRYRCEYRYSFPKCEFSIPLVVRNGNLWIKNIVRMTHAMMDLFSKLCGTRVHVLDSRRALWLGRRTLQRTCCVREVSTDRLWLRVGGDDLVAAATDGDATSATTSAATSPRVVPQAPGHCATCNEDDPAVRGGCIEYTAVWIPEFSLYIRLRQKTRLRGDDICINWCDTTLSREQVDSVLHYFAQFRSGTVGNGNGCCVGVDDDPCAGGTTPPTPGTLRAELYLAEHVDWDMFVPLQMQWDVYNTAGQKTHTETLHVRSVSLHNCTTLEGTQDTLSPGFCGRVRDVRVALTDKRWPSVMQKMVNFYADVMERVQAAIRANENEKLQISNWKECIHNNICMQKELILEYIGSNRALVGTKIERINALLHSLETLMKKGYE